ncbi:MAG: hypothetical protein ABJF88_01570 [Rhodothermales bacterium]
MLLRLAFVLSAALALAACDRDVPATATAAEERADTTAPLETRAQPIPLAGPIASRAAEISSLTWHGDDLLLLPQYPGRFSTTSDSVSAASEDGDSGALFALSKVDLLAFLDGPRDGALKPRAVRFEAPGVVEKVAGFDGYEAMVFDGDRVFVLIESTGATAMQGYLASGAVQPDGTVRLDAATVTPLPPQAHLRNLSYETLLATSSGVIALEEANGPAVNPHPEAYHFDTASGERDSLAVPAIEYRLTDATGLDAAGRFWAVNYFYPGDRALLRPGPDALRAKFGIGATHRREATVERLVEMQLVGGEIVLTARAPIQLELLDAERARNWEGIARLDDRGFLLATDTYPETMLAFIPADL